MRNSYFYIRLVYLFVADKTNITLRIEAEADQESFGKLKKLIASNIATPLIQSLENMTASLAGAIGETRLLRDLRKNQPPSDENTKSQGDAQQRRHTHILAAIGAVGGLLGGILGIALSLKPVTAIMQAIGSMFQMIFLPIGMILMAFLMPVLQGLAMVLGSGTFQGILKKTAEFMNFMVGLNLPKIIWGAAEAIWHGIIDGIPAFFNALGMSIAMLQIDIDLKLLALGKYIWNALLAFGEAKIVKPLQQLWNSITGLFSPAIVLISDFLGVMARGISNLPLLFASLGVLFGSFMGSLGTNLKNDLVGLGKYVWNTLYSFGDAKIVKPLRQLWSDIVGVFRTPIEVVRNIISFIWGGIKDLINAFKGISSTFSNIANLPSSLGSTIGNIFSGVAHLAGGGTILASGLAVVHKGESVVPAGSSLNGSAGETNVNLYMTVNGVTNVRDLVDKVQNEIERRTGRMLRWSS